MNKGENMIFEIIKSEGIAHKSYFIGSNGEAAVVDPRRDCDAYVNYSKKHNIKIKYIFETHCNEDYVIGSLELSKRVGAEIYHGKNLDFAYGNPVKDGDKFIIGDVELGILETPGHTDESISITLTDKSVSDDVYAVLTGDALFAGEVGRTDLYGKDEVERLAGTLYASLFDKILQLGDDVVIHPAHGAGSVCGAEIREQELTTIGYEKKTNPMLQKSKKEFIEHKLNEIIDKPPYFDKMAEYNKNGAPILCRLPYFKPLSMNELKECIKNGAQVIDIRSPPSFAGAYIPGTLSIWKDGLTVYGGWMLNYEDPIVIINEKGEALDEVVRYLVRIGFDNVFSYLAGGFEFWFKNAGETVSGDAWSVHKLKENLEDESIFLLDVRKTGDWEKSGHIKGAHHVFVGYLKNHLDEIPKDKHIVAYCDSGNKSNIAASLLEKNGYKNVTNVLGSMGAWLKAGYPVVKD